MLMTLLVMKEGKDVWYTGVHSNHHQFAILENILKYFKYDFLGISIVGNNTVNAKILKDKIDKVVKPFEIYKWEKGIDLRKDKEFFKSIDSFIIMDLGEYCNNIYTYIYSTMPDDDSVYREMKKILKIVRG